MRTSRQTKASLSTGVSRRYERRASRSSEMLGERSVSDGGCNATYLQSRAKVRTFSFCYAMTL